MAKGRRTYQPSKSTSPEIADAIGRVFDHWRNSVETLRAKWLNVPVERMAFQWTHRRCATIETVLRGRYGRQQVGEVALCRAISAYATYIEARPWYRDDPISKVFTLDRLLGDEGELAKWVLKATAAGLEDERRAEQELQARRRKECGEQRAANEDRINADVTAELDRLAANDPAALARLEQEGLLRMSDFARQRAMAGKAVTIATNRMLRGLVHHLLRQRMFPDGAATARTIGSVLADKEVGREN